MATAKVSDRIYVEPMQISHRRKYTLNLASADGTNDASTSDTGFLQSRTISSVATITAPTGMTKNSQANDTTTITLDVSSGTSEGDYEWDITVTLSTSETQPFTVIIPVRDPGSN